ncbi:SAM-dependent methyltransferase [Allosaccharopolyspora coralli]|nr:SAM-dependent methyltransferase [Allosaccharopolyspora coralli]
MRIATSEGAKMVEQPNWLPKGVDLEKPSAARCYDYYLGGAHNFAVDREFARQVQQIAPNVGELAQNNRAFLRRAVRYCVDNGIDQFLDLGSGIPTVGNVHEIAQRVNPSAKVVYVDNEPVAVAHSQTMLADNPNAAMVHADMLDVDTVFAAPQTRELLDLTKPVAVMMVAVMHFVGDDKQPQEVVRRYTERLAPGSYLGFSHVTGDHYRDELESAVSLYANSTNPLTLRSRGEVEGLLSDLDLIDPGVVYVPLWQPESPEDVWEDPSRSWIYAAVGRLP